MRRAWQIGNVETISLLVMYSPNTTNMVTLLIFAPLFLIVLLCFEINFGNQTGKFFLFFFGKLVATKKVETPLSILACLSPV